MPVVGKPEFEPSLTHTEQAALVLKLRSELGDLRDYVMGDLGYGAEDARVVGVTNLAAVVNSAFYVKNILSMVEHRVLDFGAMLRIPPADRAVVVPVLMRTWSKATRHEMTVMYQFQVENLLRNLCVAFGQSAPHAFPDLALRILRLAGFDAPARNVRVLNIAHAHRNSLHNNGVHRLASARTTLSGVEFRFVQGRPVRQASWSHTVLALRGSTWILGRILGSRPVRDLPAPVIDPYADMTGYESI